MRLDLDNTEEQRPIKQSFCGSLRRDTHWKCLILSTLITGCLAAIAWCRLTVITRVVINFYEMPITQTAHASPCDDGYIYIPVAFVVMLYLVYLVECWHSHTRIELQYKVDVNTVYERIQAMREALPIVWWKAVCYHYVRRTRQVTRYRNGDAFTTTQVYYERVNSHTARSAFNFSHCGIKDISKNLINLEGYPATKIKFSKGFSFATVEAENEFEDQRAQFFHTHERRDDYMETREGLDLLNVNFKEYMIAFADPDNLPWYVSHIVFWIASILLLSWPLRVCIEYKTAYVHYHVHKLFGCNYLDPGCCPGTMSRVSTMGSSELEMNIRNNYTLVPSYSEALLMENCYSQHQQQTQVQNGNLSPSSIVNGFIPNSTTTYGTIPNGVAVSISNGSITNITQPTGNGHIGLSNGHRVNGSIPNSLLVPGGTSRGLANGHVPNGGVPVILSYNRTPGAPGQEQEEEIEYLAYNSQRMRRRRKGKLRSGDPLAVSCVQSDSDISADQDLPLQNRPRPLSVGTLDSTMPGSIECHGNVLLDCDHPPGIDSQSPDSGQCDPSLESDGQQVKHSREADPGGGPGGDRVRVSDPTLVGGRINVLSPLGGEPSTLPISSDEYPSLELCDEMVERVVRHVCESELFDLPTSRTFSGMPSKRVVVSSEATKGMSSSQTAPPSSQPFISTSSPSSPPPMTRVSPSSSHQYSSQGRSPQTSPVSPSSTSSSQASLTQHSRFSSRRTSSIDLPLVHASSSRTTSVPYRRSSGSFHASSSAGTSPPGTPPNAGTPSSQGSPRHAPSVQSNSSQTLSCHSTSSHSTSCQSSSSHAPSYHSLSSNATSSYSASSHVPSPQSSPRHGSRSGQKSCSSCHSRSPHCSPRQTPSAHSTSHRSSPRHTPSPHSSPRRVLSSQSSTTSPIQSPSPHVSPRHVASCHASPRHGPVNSHSVHSSPSPHCSPRHVCHVQVPPSEVSQPEVPPPAYEEALTMRVVQESPVHGPNSATTNSNTELSETPRSSPRRYTLRCMETSL